ncbi:probable TfdA family oxidoreductase [Cephalotrichum gorgonifer]|uniref:Probable TfdA family oxidoreductase n=1 Tax=Cephalotrichum gorgonifer TaxID=2041049 RepID=A0AAE8N575_9PEZI|nr:probable TfdA family oxidoreductase [Cephalotrichum gorgonifer]
MSTTVTSLATPAALVAGPPGQPDISYAPDFAKYQARVTRHLAQGNLKTTLPENFPEKLTGDLVWEGDTLAETYDWTYVLNEEQLAEVDAALEHFKSLGLPLGHISADTFPLPNLHPELRRLSHELHHGHGFFVIRGVNVESHTREENIIIYAGISSHIGPKRGRQDKRTAPDGAPIDVVLAHIKDLSGARNNASIGAPSYTADKQVFHTDSGDIVSLFALSTAEEGGASKLASTWRVYNELAKTRPDLIHTLTEDWAVEIFNDPNRQFVLRPLIFHQPATESSPERILLQYARRSLVGFGALPRSEKTPPLTEAQAEALDALHFLGEKFCVSTGFEKGDIQYVNNLAVFHARDGFRDSEEKKRHLVRLWLRDPENAWETPEKHLDRWAWIYEGSTPDSQVFPLEAYLRGESHKS